MSDRVADQVRAAVTTYGNEWVTASVLSTDEVAEFAVSLFEEDGNGIAEYVHGTLERIKAASDVLGGEATADEYNEAHHQLSLCQFQCTIIAQGFSTLYGVGLTEVAAEYIDNACVGKPKSDVISFRQQSRFLKDIKGSGSGETEY